jgi:GNAT superfamily N-acetyltransferase
MAYIRRATVEDAELVTELRLTAYRQAQQFRLSDQSPIRWTSEDEKHVVLGAWNGCGQLVSTTRGEVYLDYDAAEQAMECRWKSSPELFPALLLGKGATQKEYRGTGLHSALRYHFLSAAREAGLRSVLGIVFENAPRTRLMERIGYEFVVADSFWYTDLTSLHNPLIAVLRSEHLEQACAALHKEMADTLKAYPFTGPSLAEALAGIGVNHA